MKKWGFLGILLGALMVMVACGSGGSNSAGSGGSNSAGGGAIELAFDFGASEVGVGTTLNLRASVSVNGSSVSDPNFAFSIVGGSTENVEIVGLNEDQVLGVSTGTVVVRVDFLDSDDVVLESATVDVVVGATFVMNDCVSSGAIGGGVFVGIVDQKREICTTINGDVRFLNGFSSDTPDFFLQFLAEVSGTLNLDYLAVSGDGVVFPNLVRVGGNLNLNTRIEGLLLKFPALEYVGGELIVNYFIAGDDPEFPLLRELGSLYTGVPKYLFDFIGVLDFPSLVSINGAINAYYTYFVTFSAQQLRFVGGGIYFDDNGYLNAILTDSLEEVLGVGYDGHSIHMKGFHTVSYGNKYDFLTWSLPSLVEVEHSIYFGDDSPQEHLVLEIPSGSASIDGDGCFVYQQSLGAGEIRDSSGAPGNIVCLD